jgi:hypothetical protein
MNPGAIPHDNAVHWRGGLPYEVASVEEVKTFLAERGWALERVREVPEGNAAFMCFGAHEPV